MHTTGMHANRLEMGRRLEVRSWFRLLVIAQLTVLGLGAGASMGRAQSSGDSARTRVMGQPADSSGAFAGVLIDAHDGRPIPYGTVVLMNKDQDAFANAQGIFRLLHLAPGTYTVRARQIGYSPKDTTITLASGAAVTGLTFRLAPIALPLPSVVVRPGACANPGPPDSTADPELAGIFAQVRENVDRFRIVLDEYPFRYTRQDSLVFRSSSGADRVLSVDTTHYESRAHRPYRVGQVLFTEKDVHGKPGQFMYLPSFPDLADSTFLANHCWNWGGVGTLGNGSTDRMLIVHFVPADRIHLPDVAGAIYLDSTRLIVRRAIYRLTNPDAVRPPVPGLTVTTSYREFVPLVPYVDSIVSSRSVSRGMVVPLSQSGHNQALVPVGPGALIEFARLLYYGFEGEAPGGIPGTEAAIASAPRQPATQAADVQSWKAPAMPGELRRYRLVRGPISESTPGGVAYSYAHGEDSINVSIEPYDATTGQLTRENALDLLDGEYSVALDSLHLLADQNDASLVMYSHGENQLQLKGGTYLGIAYRWTWMSRYMRRTGCDPSFLTQAAIRVGWSCFQQSYALPEGLLRIRAQLYGGETVSSGELTVFGNELVAAIVARDQRTDASK